jgi:hypothetical protein
MDDQIQNLIRNYLALAHQVANELRQSLGVEWLLRSVNSGAVPRRGQNRIFGGGEYFFHGIGCRLSATELEIDFDFGPEESLVGADPWKLYNFAADHGEAYPWLPDRESFRREIEGMISRGQLHYCGSEPATHLVCLSSAPPVPDSSPSIPRG